MERSIGGMRLRDVRRFYDMLAELETRLGGTRTLAQTHGRMDWPLRGIYFFFEPGEFRTTSGTGLRVTRVGTHALNAGSCTTLWHRLSQHQGTVGGTRPGGGNHRGSVFRRHVGAALIRRDNWPPDVSAHWGRRPGSDAIRQRELPLEQAVSGYIRTMPFLWLAVADAPGPGSLRGYLERNAIALLSNWHGLKAPIDPSSLTWLGRWADGEAIRQSGLWNVNHVMEDYDPGFLDVLERHIG